MWGTILKLLPIRLVLCFMMIFVQTACSSQVIRSDVAQPSSVADEAYKKKVKDGGFVYLYSLPKMQASFSMKRTNGKFSVDRKDPIFAPDPDNLYALTYDYSWRSKDNFTIKTTPQGLLEEVSATSKGVLPATIKTISNFVTKLASGGLASVQNLVPCSGSKDDFKEINVVFDPAETSADLSLQYEASHCIKIEITPRNNENLDQLIDADYCTIDGGVRYRLPLPYIIEFTDLTSEKTARFSVLVPNGPIGCLDIRRRAFIENKTTASFSNGVLTGLTIDNPDAMTEVASIPLDIVKAILSVPGALVQGAIAQDTTLAELKAQNAILKIQAENAKFIADIEKKEKNE